MRARARLTARVAIVDVLMSPAEHRGRRGRRTRPGATSRSSSWRPSFGPRLERPGLCIEFQPLQTGSEW